MRDLLIRIALGSPCLGIAVWFMIQPSWNLWVNMLGVFPCLVAFGVIVTPSWTSVVASVFREFFMPEREAQEKPDSKRAETLRFNDKYGESLIEYERLLQRFPDDLQLWNAVFELAWVHLGSAETASELLARARSTGTHPDRMERIQHLETTHRRRYLDRQRVAATA